MIFAGWAVSLVAWYLAQLAMDCALTITEDYPVVINHLCSHFVGKSVREYPEIQQHLMGNPWLK